MINTKIPLPTGWVTIWGIKTSGERVLLVDRKNATVANAKTIIAKALAKQAGAFIDRIIVYKSGSIIATSTTMTYSFPDVDQVQFDCRFNETSFNDTFDELRLDSSGLGNFAEISGLSVLKDDTLQLQITWLVTINDL